MDLISIITPTRNRFQQILTCINQVYKQQFNYPAVEHVIIDDASTDNTKQLPYNIMVDDDNNTNRLQIIHLPTQVGAGKARNIGVTASHGKYITFVDDDDILYPNHCKDLYEAIQGHDFVHGIADKYQDGLFIGQWYPTNKSDITIKNFIPICTVMISRHAWNTVGGINESLPFYQDWDLWLRLIKAGFQPKFIPVVTSIIKTLSPVNEPVRKPKPSVL